jgi:AraC family transcriptional activator of tynA and feaB
MGVSDGYTIEDVGQFAGGPADSAIFANLRAYPGVCYGKRDGDIVLLCYIGHGSLQLDQGEEVIVLDSRSGLVPLDCDKPATTSSTADDLSYLALPRERVVAALGGSDPTPPGAALRRLPRRELTPVLQAYLKAVTENGATLDRFERAAAAKAATALAVALLSQLGQKLPEESDRPEDTLLEAALSYIKSNCWRHSLTADKIAAAIGCSRAHLYRLFAARCQSVAHCVRDIRLQRARKLLETESAPIGTIAFDSGYGDQSAFGKAFKRHFGISPSDYRASIGWNPPLDLSV